MHQYTVTIEWPGFERETLYFDDIPTAFRRGKLYGFRVVEIRGRAW